jgi:glycosyltransferase involved in cell wall biosynthesis
MKVAIVTTVLSHFEVPLFRLAASLSGIDVRVLHTDPNADSFYTADYGAVIDWGERLRDGYPNTYYSDATALRAATFAWKPEVILQYGYAWKGALALLTEARLRRVPIVQRGLTSIYHDPRSTRFRAARRRARDFVLGRFDAHHFGGDFSRQVLESIGVDRRKMYFVPFSVDSPFFAAQADSPEAQATARQLKVDAGWGADDPTILFLANHSWVKGPDVFIAAAALAQKRVPLLKVIMVGAGTETDALKAQAAATLISGSYRFPGFVPSKSTVPYYLAADLAIFPSRYETWARAINEAMLCRRPCITTKWVAASGGLVEAKVNGYVMQDMEPERCADAVLTYLGLPAEQRRYMGEAARDRALAYSYEATVDNLRASFVETATR